MRARRDLDKNSFESRLRICLANHFLIRFDVKHDNTHSKTCFGDECRSEPRGENDVSVFADSEY
jgi:hypothetical protein